MFFHLIFKNHRNYAIIALFWCGSPNFKYAIIIYSKKKTTMKKTITLIILICTLLTGYSQNITIPNITFKNYLLLKFDTNFDREISKEEAEAVTGTIKVSYEKINDLTGLEAFINITGLDCSSNSELIDLDISKNTALISLKCSNNGLKKLDVSNNIALKKLECSFNWLTSLDVSNNIALTELYCATNKLTSLDVSNNPTLEILESSDNISIRNLDISNNPALEKLECYLNGLTTLDVSKNTVLTELYCQLNKLTTLDIYQNKDLIGLNCSNNQLATLNISKHKNLTYVNCKNNARLHTICIIHISRLPYNFNADVKANKVSDCNNIIEIPDTNFKAELIAQKFDLNNDGDISKIEAMSITTLNVNSR